jgi:hypothetical protein
MFADMAGNYAIAAFLGFLGGVVFTLIVAVKSKKKKPPKLAGTAIPEIGDGLDIVKRYDIVYSGDYGSPFVEKLLGVRILGYVGREDDETISKMYMRGRWLVVEFSDGRRAYLMPHAILSLQESSAA